MSAEPHQTGTSHAQVSKIDSPTILHAYVHLITLQQQPTFTGNQSVSMTRGQHIVTIRWRHVLEDFNAVSRRTSFDPGQKCFYLGKLRHELKAWIRDDRRGGHFFSARVMRPAMRLQAATRDTQHHCISVDNEPHTKSSHIMQEGNVCEVWPVIGSLEPHPEGTSVVYLQVNPVCR